MLSKPRIGVLGSIFAAALLLTGCLGRSTGPHVWVIVESGQSLSGIQGNASAPFLNALGKQFV